MALNLARAVLDHQNVEIYWWAVASLADFAFFETGIAAGITPRAI